MQERTIFAEGRFWTPDEVMRGDVRPASKRTATMRDADDGVVKVDMAQLVRTYADKHHISHAEADQRLRRAHREASEGPPASALPREESDTVGARATRLLARSISHERGIPLGAAQVIALRMRATATGRPLAVPPVTSSLLRLQAKGIAATTGVSLGDAQRSVYGRAVETNRLMTNRAAVGAEDRAPSSVGESEIVGAMTHATRVVRGAPKNMQSSVLVAMVAQHLVEDGMTRVRADAMAAVAVQQAIIIAAG